MQQPSEEGAWTNIVQLPHIQSSLWCSFSRSVQFSKFEAHLIAHILEVGYSLAAAVNDMQFGIKAENPPSDTAAQMPNPFHPNKCLGYSVMDQFH